MQRFSNILVAVDATAAQTPVLECAAQLALAHGAQLKVVDVVPEFGWAQRLVMAQPDHLHELIERERGQMLAEKIAPLAARGIRATAKVLRGRTSTAIIDECAAAKHDLVMRHAKGPASRRAGSFGTTAFELLRRCSAAVYLHHADSPTSCHRLVAAVDANPEEPDAAPLNEHILDAAVAIRDLARAQLDIIHVWSIYGERMVKDYMRTSEFAELEQSVRAEHEQTLQKLLSSCGLAMPSEQLHLIRGEPTIEIPNFVRANNTDLLIMGTVGRRGMAGFLLGNTAEMVLSQLPCSVLAVKPPGFQTEPVKSEAAPVFVPEMPPVP